MLEWAVLCRARPYAVPWGVSDESLVDAMLAGPLAELAALEELAALAEGRLGPDQCHEPDRLAFFD